MSAVSLSGLDDRDIAAIVRDGARVADALRGATILVTGATGWFGTWLLDALVALDAAYALDLHVVAMSRDPARFAARHPRLASAAIIEWIAADVTHPDLACPRRPTHVVHAATEASAALNASSPSVMFDTIVTGTRNVLDLAARAGARRVLLTSSGAVYGAQPNDVAHLDEDHVGGPNPLDARNAYAEGKRAAEQLAAIGVVNGGPPVAIARCFAFVGPHMPFDAHFAIGNFIRDAMDADAIVIQGDGTPTRSYLYMTDLVTWLLVLLVEGPSLRPFNVGSSTPVSIGDLASRCAQLAREQRGLVPAVRIEARSRGGASYVPATRRAESELGLRTSVDLAEAIRRTMAWRSAQRPVARVVAETVA